MKTEDEIVARMEELSKVIQEAKPKDSQTLEEQLVTAIHVGQVLGLAFCIGMEEIFREQIIKVARFKYIAENIN